MGSVRRGLTLAALFAPSAALAEACATLRPGWDGTQATALDEALTLLLSPLGLLLLAISVLAARFPSKWLSVLAVMGWTGFISLSTMLDPLGLRLDAINEGCVGSPSLFILIATGISVAVILYTTSQNRSSRNGET